AASVMPVQNGLFVAPVCARAEPPIATSSTASAAAPENVGKMLRFFMLMTRIPLRIRAHEPGRRNTWDEPPASDCDRCARPPARKSAATAAMHLRRMAALLEGLRALGSGRVVDEVLALVLDSAIEVTGAERGFIMLADAHGALEFTLARARGKITLSGRSFE